jgi:hypothetical protein
MLVHLQLVSYVYQLQVDFWSWSKHVDKWIFVNKVVFLSSMHSYLTAFLNFVVVAFIN